MTWRVTAIAGHRTVEVSVSGTALEAASAGLDAARAAHPELPAEAWMLRTEHRHDRRVNVHCWRRVDGGLLELVERREHWVETAGARKARR
jgi:hypothetical protein